MIVVRYEREDGPERDFEDQEFIQFIVDNMLQKIKGVNENLS
jgi:hypothetical protein